MKIYLGADHRGFKLKEEIKVWLTGLGHEVVDVGAKSYEKDDDYVDFAAAAAVKITEEGRGILICGSGAGMEIAANRVKGIRCSLGLSPEQVAAARNDDDINVLSIAADYTNSNSAKNLIKTFLDTPFFQDEKHLRRLKKLNNLSNY